MSIYDPLSTSTPAEFTAAMRRLKSWSGLSYRDLERRAGRNGTVLPRSTLTTALSRDSLPREELVEAFTQACGLDQREATRWVAARRRLAAGGSDPGRGTAYPADGSLVARLLPPVWCEGSRLTRLLILALLAVVPVSSAAIGRLI
jgi:hypothetical protein